MLIHLGIERHTNVQHSEALIKARISLARRTSYALMGTGFHGNNGISPAFTIPIYRTYVIPRLSGTYTLQSNKVVFNQFQVVATCPLCKSAAEDRLHFVLECPTLDLIRNKYMPNIAQLIPDFTSFNCDQQLSAILDTHPNFKCRRTDLEAVSRTFLFSLHCARTKHINGS